MSASRFNADASVAPSQVYIYIYIQRLISTIPPDYLWGTYGMGSPPPHTIGTYGDYMGIYEAELCDLWGPMVLRCVTYEITYGMTVRCLWDAHGNTSVYVCLWDTYGMPMGYLWDAYMMPMGCL